MDQIRLDDSSWVFHVPHRALLSPQNLIIRLAVSLPIMGTCPDDHLLFISLIQVVPETVTHSCQQPGARFFMLVIIKVIIMILD